ncbi:MAG TPA: hypothetical protein VF062_12045 [Candidatus Limnocylindrales bacterium]
MLIDIGPRLRAAERALLHRYAIWHHLRRLRNRLRGNHVTHLQALNIRCHITAAVNFLDWLGSRNLTLPACTQVDLDDWIASDDVSYRDETGHFIRWATTNRQATSLTYGTVRWQGPAGPLDTEKRWADARKLLHDNTINTSDRVAGLLLLLYAQRVSAISQLTVDDVHADGKQIRISLGRVPVVLPQPLAGLVLELVTTRRPYTVIGQSGQTSWLFPGQRPGHHLCADRLGQRLIALGIQPGRTRSTALFTLAQEVPAALLARTLGIHIIVATQWQQAASGDWSTYAADVSRREHA